MKWTENFELKEFLHDGVDCVPVTVLTNMQILVNNLQILREEIEKPIHINSGYRTKEHNKKIGGSPASQHLLGKAADIWVPGVTAVELESIIERLIRSAQMKQGGLGLYDNFVHYDIRGYRARWDYRKKAG